MRRSIPIHHRQPQGFSLIEILIVISILAALVALSLTVLGTAGEAARIAATRATITQVDALLRDQLAGFNRTQGTPTNAVDIENIKTAAKAGFPQSIAEFSVTGTGIDLESELLYHIITQGRVTGATPVGEDAFNASELTDTDGDGNMELVDAWGNQIRFYRWPTRLLNPFGFGATNLTSAINADTMTTSVDVDNEGPFSSYVSPTQTIYVAVGKEIMQVTATSSGNLTVVRGAAGTSPEAHHAGATVKLAPFPHIVSLLMGSLTVGGAIHDPDDPRGSLPSSSYNATTFEDEFHTLDSYHAPLIISAGPDGILGLEEPYDTSDYGYLAKPLSTIDIFTLETSDGDRPLDDNITNLSGGN
ncbi:MAG: prepilin-type N-terminal cleavage/methylation domain-containing protein [Planctomycetaceae bacterium]|nr:prepilin-type N-terminal cleavage/methylation domain-containing protein [Planctomycetaceae bacterium]